jgi:hypothetical protein
MMMRRITMMDDARTEEKRKRLKGGSQISGQSRLIVRAGIMALAVTVLSVMNVGVTPADDQPLPSMTIGYKNGTITAIYEKTFQIDGRTYSLTPDAVILDDSGNQLDAGRLAVTLEVKYHVKKGQTDNIDNIDRMILFLFR